MLLMEIGASYTYATQPSLEPSSLHLAVVVLTVYKGISDGTHTCIFLLGFRPHAGRHSPPFVQHTRAHAL